MRKLTLTILFLLFSNISLGVVPLIDRVAPKNDDGTGGSTFDKIVSMINVGAPDSDSIIDMNNDGIIDPRRLLKARYAVQDGYVAHYDWDGDSLYLAEVAGIKWRDSSYIYLDTANILGGNTEIKAWLDTTAVRVPIADSAHGGATRATTAKVTDSTDGGAARAQSTQGLRGVIVTDDTPADGEILVYEADSSRWIMGTQSGGSSYNWLDSAAANAGYGLTTTTAGADSMEIDSTDIANWNLWTTAYDWGDHSVPGYLTGNETITLSGDVTGSGATAITTAIAAQAIKPDDIDSTGEDFVFAQVYKGMSSNSDSQLVTIETIEDSLTGYLINSGNDTIAGSFTATSEIRANELLYVDLDSNADMSYIYYHGTQGSFGFYAPTAGDQQGFHFNHDLHLGGHEIKTVKHPSHDSSAVNRGYAKAMIEDSLDGYLTTGAIQAEIEDSLNEYVLTISLEDSLNGYSITSVVRDIAHDTLWAHLQYEVVPFIFVHSHPGKPGDNDTTSLECFDSDSLGAYIFKMTFGATDQVDTVMLSTILPYKCTRGDSLIYKYATSSATGATIKIDAIKVSVEGVSQTDFATDRSSTATAYVRESLGADADYNEKEQVTVRFIVAGDSGAWLKVYTAFLVVSR